VEERGRGDEEQEENEVLQATAVLHALLFLRFKMVCSFVGTALAAGTAARIVYLPLFFLGITPSPGHLGLSYLCSIIWREFSDLYSIYQV
jgi:hypothetical protein